MYKASVNMLSRQGIPFKLSNISHNPQKAMASVKEGTLQCVKAGAEIISYNLIYQGRGRGVIGKL